MAGDPPEPSPPPAIHLRPRRETFEHGLLPIPSLTSPDPVPFLSSLASSLPRSAPVDSSTLAGALRIGEDQAQLVLDALDAVDPKAGEGGVGVDDLVLFLYVQTYKRLVPRTHKDSSAVTDVWPSTSAFDRCLSALSPIQLVRSNSRRFMPSQADEEIHQLSYIQKHIGNMLTLLATPQQADDDESLVLTVEKIESLGLLIQFYKNEYEAPLREAATLFSNADAELSTLLIPATQVHEWFLQNIATSLEQMSEKMMAKENSQSNNCGTDDDMGNGSTIQTRTSSESSLESNSLSSRNPTFVEGISKGTVVKRGHEIRGSTVKVLNCHDSVIYLLAPMKYATIYGCSDTTIVLGAIGKALRVEHCERVQIITATKRMCVANCRECILYLGVNQRPLVIGDNHKLQVAPYNTFYPQLNEHLNQVGLDVASNKWNEPLVLGMVDPHDSMSHPAGISDVQPECPTCLDPEKFTCFVIPNLSGDDLPQPIKDNPFSLPESYMAYLTKHNLILDDIQQAVRDAKLEENKRKELNCALHVHFRDWLYATGNIRQLYCSNGD